jgi:N-acetylglucosaminyldiphosphoundecaprenol N-acetyl-beta-D-mannosaminyltransferase
VSVTPRTAQDVVDHLLTPAQRPQLVLNHNLHSVYLINRDEWFRKFYENASLIVIDGWPVLRAAEKAKGVSLGHAYRIGSTDWIAALKRELSTTQRRYRIFVLGGDEATNWEASQRLQDGSKVEVAGTHGYFEAADTTAVVERIREFAPDLVLVGMGMPHQERFLFHTLHQLPPAHYATVGGAIDYVAGRQRLAPRVLGRLGLEWLWRLVNDPVRLFHRYLVEPIKLVALLASHRVRRQNADAQ